MRTSELDRALGEIASELSGLAVVCLRGGEIAYEGYFGRRYIDPESPERDLPITRETKFRAASISKTFAALGAMTLVDRGLLDLDRDISDYLGFRLRNPQWPDAPITAAMLLSHTSSLRDGSGYSLALGHTVSEFFEPGRDAYEEGGHFAPPDPSGGADRSPGQYYSYCNLGYGLLASAMERLSGERFDLYMRRRVLGPLGIDASYNVLTLSERGFRNLATIYRKGRGGESWDPAGPWLPQVDDYCGERPASPCKLDAGLGLEALERYEPGSNGTLFSPQGGLRISAVDIAEAARLLMGGGALGGARIVSPNAVSRMESVAWRYDPARPNGELEEGATRATGLGLVRTTNSRDALGGDSLLPGGGPLLWGHHADAYGLLGGVLFEPETGFGLVYLIGGTPRDPGAYRGSHYSRTRWEEAILEAVAREAY
jgi:D-alanyl-D-alanine carboxypeptidase